MPPSPLPGSVVLLSLLAFTSFAGEKGLARPENHLAGQTSPYLLQHLHNPVDWYPWGEAAFEKARRENKPIFLSVGYSTCHWCHVMERESFENEEVAAILNAHFVCIKVDREERPDIDRLYMSFVEGSTGIGGWPLNVFLSPELKPFFGGSYYPAEDQGGRPGFKTLLRRVSERWEADPERIREQAGRMLEALSADTHSVGDEKLDTEACRAKAVTEIRGLYDSVNGGFEKAPKFPNAVFLGLLSDYQATGSDPALRAAAEAMGRHTLEKICSGGLRDHIGGGFHRYAVDEAWQLPHFEKMLNDQALIGGACLDAWLTHGEPLFKDSLESCLDYLERRMRCTEGGYYTAEDADSASTHEPGPRKEGAHYLWTQDEVKAVLGPEEGELFCLAYDLHNDGNLPRQAEGEFHGKNQPRIAQGPAQLAKIYKSTESSIQESLRKAKALLMEARLKRPLPALDDKVLCAWNGLVLSLLAKTALHLDDPQAGQRAIQLAQFLRKELYDEETGTLSRSWRLGRRGGEAFAEDYAFVIQGLLDLFENNQDSCWLEWAMRLQTRQDQLFHDAGKGGYFASSAKDTSVLVRMKSSNDGAEPAATSVAIRNQARLAGLLHQPERLEQARRDLSAFSRTLTELPTALPAMLEAAGWLKTSPQQVIIVGKRGEAATDALIAEVRRRRLPRLSLLVLQEGNRGFLVGQSEFLASLPPVKTGEAMGYVCQNFQCQLPSAEAKTFGQLLEKTR